MTIVISEVIVDVVVVVVVVVVAINNLPLVISRRETLARLKIITITIIIIIIK